MERYIGDIKIMKDPKFEKIQILWMFSETFNMYKFPAIWFIYEDIIYFGLSKYKFNWFEDYSDFILPSGLKFNMYKPGEAEWDYMIKLGYEYRILDYNKAILYADDLDYWCDFELDFIKKWYRDKRIGDILK